MNDKYFYFRRSTSGTTSSTVSDKGVGVDVLAVPVSKVSFISTKPSKVTIYFSGVSPYEDVQLSDNQVFEKSFVDISSDLGKESDLVASILDFITSEKSSKKIMRFDVSSSSSFRDSIVTDINDVSTIVPATPVLTPQRATSYLPSGATSFVVEGIDYGSEENYPLLDFVAATAYITATGASGDTVGSWSNAAQKTDSSLYDFVPGNLGSAPFFYNDGDGSTGGVLGTFIKLSGQQGFEFDSSQSLTLSGEYTIFMCLGVANGQDFPLFNPIYGSDVLSPVSDANRQCFGPFSPDSVNTFSFRHANRYGVPAEASSNADDGTVSAFVPDIVDAEDIQTCYVFVVRRDEVSNIFVHNNEGHIIATVPASFGSQYSDGVTTGDLFIQGIISVSPASTVKFFDGSIKRFGVIERDIGASEASNIANILNDLYNPN